MMGWLALALVCALVRADLSIDAFGAIAGDTSFAAAQANGVAFFNAVQAANSGPDRAVLVPFKNVYTFVPHGPLSGIAAVTVRIAGTLSLFSTNHSQWPRVAGQPDNLLNAIEFDSSNNITIEVRPHASTFIPTARQYIGIYTLFSCDDFMPTEAYRCIESGASHVMVTC